MTLRLMVICLAVFCVAILILFPIVGSILITPKVEKKLGLKLKASMLPYARIPLLSRYYALPMEILLYISFIYIWAKIKFPPEKIKYQLNGLEKYSLADVTRFQLLISLLFFINAIMFFLIGSIIYFDLLPK